MACRDRHSSPNSNPFAPTYPENNVTFPRHPFPSSAPPKPHHRPAPYPFVRSLFPQIRPHPATSPAPLILQYTRAIFYSIGAAATGFGVGAEPALSLPNGSNPPAAGLGPPSRSCHILRHDCAKLNTGVSRMDRRRTGRPATECAECSRIVQIFRRPTPNDPVLPVPRGPEPPIPSAAEEPMAPVLTLSSGRRAENERALRTGFAVLYRAA